MTDLGAGVLLDTCAVIWLANGDLPKPVVGSIVEVELSPEIAVDASYLPGDMHGDPADRHLVATARHLGIPIATRDARIIAYAGQGFVRVLPC